MCTHFRRQVFSTFAKSRRGHTSFVVCSFIHPFILLYRLTSQWTDLHGIWRLYQRLSRKFKLNLVRTEMRQTLYKDLIKYVSYFWQLSSTKENLLFRFLYSTFSFHLSFRCRFMQPDIVLLRAKIRTLDNVRLYEKLPILCCMRVRVHDPVLFQIICHKNCVLCPCGYRV